jgi:HJR/Mrr/RecB family endonuclease
MSQNSHKSSFDISLILIVILGVTAWTHRVWLIYLLYALLATGLLGLCRKLIHSVCVHRQDIAFTDIDSMDGLVFEHYVADLLCRHGFENVSLTEQYDMGVDIIADKNGERWGIQVKRYSDIVKAAAVRQVVTALRFYGCERSMVISNSTYSNVAQQLADSNDCVLINRSELLQMIG